MNESAFLTIIVPAYNVERFLGQCLNSLVNQSLMAHTVIVVNDGSSDGTGEIAKKYAKDNPELIDYIEQENRGLGAARNVGLQKVKTSFVTFLDSDDWIPPRYVEMIRSRIYAEDEVPDMVFTLPTIYDMRTHFFVEWLDDPLFHEIFDGGGVLNIKSDSRLLALEPSSCRRIYSTDFLHRMDFSFPEGTKWEDVEPHFCLLHAADRCIGTESTGFFYRINSGGQITASGGEDRLQVVTVFSCVLSHADKEQWTDTEYSYILKMMASFMEWSMNCASVHVRSKLVQKIHKLYISIPRYRFNEFYKTFPLSRREKMMIKLLRSPIYGIAKNEHSFRVARGVCKRLLRLVGQKEESI